jgi:small-conductance mechanosensitive channel
MKTVPRIGRLLDLAGLLLFMSGGAALVWAWIGFRSVTEYEPPSDGPLWAAVDMADGYWRLERLGSGLMLAGVAVFILAWWVARASARRASSPSSAP